MEEARRREFIFHLYRADGQSLILSPFDNPERLRSGLEIDEIEGRYGEEIKVELLTSFRDQLYRDVETAVRKHLAEARFAPRLFISAAVFFAAFLVMSRLLPAIYLIDDLLVAIGGAVATYLYMGRRDMASDAAMKKRVALRNAVDKVKFVPSKFVERVEQELHRTESGNPNEIAQAIVGPGVADGIADADGDEARQFLRLLEEKYKFKRLRREEKALLKAAEEPAADADSVRKWWDVRKVDAPLYAVYRRFKRTVEKVETQ